MPQNPQVARSTIPGYNIFSPGVPFVFVFRRAANYSQS
jgi:hypothetical protein